MAASAVICAEAEKQRIEQAGRETACPVAAFFCHVLHFYACAVHAQAAKRGVRGALLLRWRH